MRLKPVKIDDINVAVPIIQGGMGVGVSLAGLAGAVAKEGGVGVISASQPGYADEASFGENSFETNFDALKKEIKKAKEISGGGVIGVNILCVARRYDDYVKAAIDGGADLIISGAGLPADLPKLTEGSGVKFAPVVSSLRVVKALFRAWQKRYGRVSDFVVIEGPMAGGHLGFSNEYLEKNDFSDYDAEVKSIVDFVSDYGKEQGKKIPVFFGGGVFDRADIDKYIALGCDGVQMATRFVATEECDADIAFKQAYVNAKKEDITIVKSPVGMPGRAINNNFARSLALQREDITKCYACLKVCDPKTTPYCITNSLIKAVKGDVENSLVFCGENVSKIDKITTVKAIFDELNA